MPITELPTTAPTSLGPDKIDKRVYAGEPYRIQAFLVNKIRQYLIDIGGTVGLSDGSTPGSVIARLGSLEAGVTALHETSGPTNLALSSIPDGTFLRRQGSTIVGAAGMGGSDAQSLWSRAIYNGVAPAGGQALVWSSSNSRWEYGDVVSTKTYAIVVGNQPAGDTTQVCTYLDPGDGTGIAAAFAAAAALAPQRVDVRLRRGTYTSATTLVPPAGCRVVGAGIGLTIVKGPLADATHDYTVFAPAANVTIESLTAVARDPIGADPGSLLGTIGIASGCTYRDLEIVLGDGAGVIQPTYAMGLAYIGTTIPDAVTVQDVTIRVANLAAFGSTVYGATIFCYDVAYTEPAKAHVYDGVTLLLPAGGFGGVAVATNILASNITRTRAVNSNSAVTVQCDLVISGTVRGPMIDGVDLDTRGSTSTAGVYVGLGATGSGGGSTPTIRGTQLTNVRVVQKSTANSNTWLCFFATQGSDVTMEDVQLSNLGASGGPAGTGNIVIDARPTAGATVPGLLVEGCYTPGDLVMIGTTANTVNSPRFVANHVRNLTVTPASLNAIVALNRITGTYTDTGVGTTVSANIVGA